MIDWDAYRAAYPTMSYADVAAFHSIVWQKFPDQYHHSPWLLRAFFEERMSGWPARVLEVGGWTGEAADMILREQPRITEWRNFEICAEAADQPVTRDHRYVAVHPQSWPWEVRLERTYWLAVLAHVIEHMSAAQLDRLVGWIAGAGVESVYVESPIRDEARSWRRSTSAHLLEIGWRGVIDLFARHGYSVRRRIDEPPERTVLYFGRAA